MPYKKKYYMYWGKKVTLAKEKQVLFKHKVSDLFLIGSRNS